MKVTINEQHIEARYALLYDSEGNRYEIRQDKFGGIEVIVEDGSCSIEPHVSNHITIKTQR